MIDIAIVGMACRMPGGLDNPDLLTAGLRRRIQTVGLVPPDRWDAQRYYNSDKAAKGKAYVNHGNFLTQDIRAMDAEFFDFPARVAENIDPQQRLLMELTWEAFENAQLSLPAHAGRNVGVYVGGFMLDHMFTMMQQLNHAVSNANTAAGMMMTMLAARLSHQFDLRGPSLSMDTACSSSLVAFSYACSDIWAGICDMAIVGGANVITRPEYVTGMCKGQFLSPDGQCKSFDERGDGYGRAEGGGVVLLKTLERAIADGDPILATVAGAGVNSDGRTPGIAMPSAEAQIRLIRDVCERFDIDPAEVRYVECHGTGTAVGDPIEARSIGTVYGAGRKDDARVVIGSIKSNIGHMEAGAGVAGVIKAVLTLQQREAFALGNLQTPHPDIPFEALGVQLADRSIRLAQAHEPFMVAVNSFGYGGTNAHVVLRTPPEPTAPRSDVPAVRRPEGFPFYLPVSARSPAALKVLAQRYLDRIREQPDEIANILYSAALRRAALTHRAVVMGFDVGQLCEGLEALARGDASEHVVTHSPSVDAKRLPVWVFSGMGPQWWAMGQALYRDEPVYRTAVDEADRLFQQIAGFSIVEEMLKDEAHSRITRTAYAQPANLIIQLGIVAVLRAAGVSPGAVVGHSVGEVAAACVSGALSLEDALRVSYQRSRLQAGLAGSGGMLAAGLGPDAIAPMIEPFAGRVEIAAINGPATITLAGQSEAIEALAAALAARHVFHRVLAVEVPYHSYLMDPILDELETSLDAIVAREPSIPLYSTVTGRRVEGPAYGADYWPKNVRQSVDFMAAVQSMLDDGFSTFVEIGPHPVLANALRECAKAKAREIHVIETLRRNEVERERLHRTCARVFASGCEIDWVPLNGGGRPAALPNYPWQRERYWLESELSIQMRIYSTALPMLGVGNYSAVNCWLNDLEHESLAYLKDHVVAGAAVMPAAGYVETVLEIAASCRAGAPGWRISDIAIHAPLVISSDRAISYVSCYDPGTGAASVHSTENDHAGNGVLHLSGTVASLPGPETGRLDLDALSQSLSVHRDVKDFYQMLAGIGFQYGPQFQLMRSLQVSRDKTQALALIELADEQSVTGYVAHPALLDACFHGLIGIIENREQMLLPTGIKELRVLVPTLPTRLWCHVTKTCVTERYIEADLTLADERGAVLMVIRALRLTAMSTMRARVDSHGDPVKLQMVRHEWRAVGYLPAVRRAGTWLVVDDRPGDATSLAARIAAGIRRYAPLCIRLHENDVGDGSAAGAEYTAMREHIAQTCSDVGSLDGVVFVHEAGAAPCATASAGTRALQRMLALTQGLTCLPSKHRPRVYVLTSGAFRISDVDGPVDPAQTALNGFTRVAFNEMSEFQFTTVDIPIDAEDRDVEAAVLELICDAPEHEVALRNGRRLSSRLTVRPWLTEPVIESASLHGRNVLIRPSKDQSAATGRFEAIEMPHLALGDDEIELAITSMVTTRRSLQDLGSPASEQAYMEVEAVVARVGPHVADCHEGQRVYGWVPAAFASHVRGPRHAFHLVALDVPIRGAVLLSRGVREALAECLIQHAQLPSHARVLIQADAMGLAIDAALRRRGIDSVLLASPGAVPLRAGADSPARVEATLAGIDAALDAHTGGAGFDALIGPMRQWADDFGWRALAAGGVLIDTSGQAQALTVPAAACAIVRMAPFEQYAERFAVELAEAVTRISRQAPEAHALPSLSAASVVEKGVPAWSGDDEEVVIHFDDDASALPIQACEQIRFDSDATYLITGGLGGFGQRTASWLIDHGARHLALAGRSEIDTEERRAFVEGLRRRGAEIVYLAGDLADEPTVKRVFEVLRDREFPLRGIFHAAAVVIDEPIVDADPLSQIAVMRSKAESAFWLDRYSRTEALDYFVLYSSIAGELGSSRQSSYVSANGFLDGLAWQRRALGLPATSINWGVISDVGIVKLDEKLGRFMRHTGLRGMQSAEALHWLERALLRDVTQLGITLISTWSEWRHYETSASESSRVVELVMSDAKRDDSKSTLLRNELAALPPGERLMALATRVSTLIAKILGAALGDVPLDRPLLELGIDSLMATEIQQSLREELGVSISVLEIGNSLTIRKIVDETLSHWRVDKQADSPSSEHSAGAAVAAEVA